MPDNVCRYNVPPPRLVLLQKATPPQSFNTGVFIVLPKKSSILFGARA
ncbi:MAG: hypothetical protein F6K39_09030 [Okeania sp. SIO3B3]|nr:hypothetical protein [Okeania sp. SIO3B3]